MHERLVRWRLWLVGFLLLLAMVGLAAQLCYLHLGGLPSVGHTTEGNIVARRGTIYDRNGRDTPMAVSLPFHQPFIDPRAVKPKHDKLTIATILAAQLNLDTDYVLAQFGRTDSRFIPLPVRADDRTYEALVTNRLVSGVGWRDVVVRSYPQGRRMSSVLGFVDRRGETSAGEEVSSGAAGIEQARNAQLKGIPGHYEGEVDGLQHMIWDRRRIYVPPVDGADVYLTLDNNIQYKVETELEAVVARFSATAAWAVVQKVSTGEILAMASWPDFDPNRYDEFTCWEWRNLPLCINYEPGSSMKPFIVAAALNEGLVTAQTRIDVGAGSWFYGGRVLHDHVEGVIDMATLLKRSSNIGAAKVALMLGNRREETYLRLFGLGSRLGLDLPGEETGILHHSRNWTVLTPTRVAIGQGVSVTSLQMLNAYCAIANDGRLMRPYLVARVVNRDGQVLYEGRPRAIAQPISPAVARQLRGMMSGVTEEGGTATRAAVPGYTVAGKTGTAEMPEPGGGYSNTDYWASFVGFLPAEQPEFGVIVVVERPRPQHMGGFVAAPVFAQIAESVARYLELPAATDIGRGGLAGQPARTRGVSRP